MKIFDHMNTSGKDVCPICKTKEDKPVTLIPIDGTEDGNTMQAKPVHVSCIELSLLPDLNEDSAIIYQILEKEVKE
jgi:hypothetical protein